MMTNSVPFLFFFFIIFIFCSLTLADSWQLEDVGDRQLLEKLRQQSPATYCVNAAGKCFSTGQCCAGLVCAAFDDYFGQKPEVPGYCVKEKDLQVCAGNSDCADGSKCASLGRTGERYCLPRPEADDRQQGRLVQLASAISKARGGLGADCRSDSDCLPEAKGERLCCQDVRRGRQGVKRVCDRATSISVCIP